MCSQCRSAVRAPCRTGGNGGAGGGGGGHDDEGGGSGGGASAVSGPGGPILVAGGGGGGSPDRRRVVSGVCWGATVVPERASGTGSGRWDRRRYGWGRPVRGGAGGSVVGAGGVSPLGGNGGSGTGVLGGGGGAGSDPRRGSMGVTLRGRVPRGSGLVRMAVPGTPPAATGATAPLVVVAAVGSASRVAAADTSAMVVAALGTAVVPVGVWVVVAAAGRRTCTRGSNERVLGIECPFG